MRPIERMIRTTILILLLVFMALPVFGQWRTVESDPDPFTDQVTLYGETAWAEPLRGDSDIQAALTYLGDDFFLLQLSEEVHFSDDAIIHTNEQRLRVWAQARVRVDDWVNEIILTADMFGDTAIGLMPPVEADYTLELFTGLIMLGRTFTIEVPMAYYGKHVYRIDITNAATALNPVESQ